MLNKVRNFLRSTIQFNLTFSSEEKEFRKNLKSKNHANRNIVSDQILLVPLIDDLGTMKLIIAMADKIAAEQNLQIRYFFIHGYIDQLRYQGKYIGKVLNALRTWSWFSINRLLRVYNIAPSQLVMSNYFVPAAATTNTRFKSKHDVLALKYKDADIGELVYDTYLRFRSKPTVDLNDDDLYVIKDYMLQLSAKWDTFFKENEVSQLLLPYLSYHHWGIPGKIALTNNIDVITFGSYLYLYQKIDINYQYHSKNFNLYPNIFKSLEDKNIRLEEAKLLVENRLSGVIDKGIAYMKSSSFGKVENSAFEFPEGRWAVIFLHCFFDSPHIYGDGLFADFHDWLTHLLTQASQNTEITYFVKRHPNALPENVDIVDSFAQQFSQFDNIRFLPLEVTNTMILNNKPDAIFTYYGTVAHEFAYNGIPAITCGENPHSAYGFVYQAKSIDQLNSLLKKVGKYHLPESYKKEDVLEFFYMHYIYYSKKYNQLNFDMVKNIEKGMLNMPADTMDELLYRN